MSVFKGQGHIYKIINTQDNEVYVGCTTKTVEERWKKHYGKNYCDPYCKKRPLYVHMNKIGRKKFHVLTIETVDYEDLKTLREKEKYYIQQYGTLNIYHNNKHKHKNIQNDLI